MSTNDENEDSADWPTEAIPNGDTIYRRAHKFKFKNGEPQPSAFELVHGMSCDWQKYASAKEARARAPKPFDNGVVSLNAGAVREIKPLAVDHSPIQRRSKLLDARGKPISPNRAHTDVNGPDILEMREKLSKLAEIEILPESEL